MSSTHTRRGFLAGSATALAGFSILPGRGLAQPGKGRICFAVLGINHEHIFRMVKAVRDGGGELAMIYAEGMDPNHGARFLSENPGVKQAREEREVLESPDVSLVVSDARPAERAQVGIRVMRAGKDFLADKGGFLNLETLAEARRVQAETRRIYAVCYNERVLMPVHVKIDELLQAGAIGRVTQMKGTGPHGLFGHGPREEWFWTRAGHGGILADVGAHQADQFLHYVGEEGAELVRAETGNFENPDHPEFEDYGRAWWRCKAGTGEATVTFYRGQSTGFRIELEGTEGRMDVSTQSGRVTLVSRDGKQRELRPDPGTVCPYGRLLVDDVLHRTETAMTQAHAFLASELAVRAQLAAARLAKKP